MNHLKSSCPTPGKVHKGVDLSAEGTSVLLGCFVLFCFLLCIIQDMETSNQGLKGFSKWEQKQNWALKGRKWYFIKNMDITYPRCLSLFWPKSKWTNGGRGWEMWKGPICLRVKTKNEFCSFPPWGDYNWCICDYNWTDVACSDHKVLMPTRSDGIC